MHPRDGAVNGPRQVIFGCLGPVLSPAEARFFREADPWGFILFARNVEDPAQLRRLTHDLREAVGREAPVLIDQEGGRVARMRGPHWLEWDNAFAFCERHADDDVAAEAMRLRFTAIGAELREVGIDVNCAPMLDIAGPATHPAIHERCYGTDAARVTRLGRAVADGLLVAGVLPVIKHIPGHGRTPLDTHLDLPRVDTSRDVLETTDFAPFKALSDLPLAMMSHIIFGAIDPDAPASQSPAHLAMLREEFGFEGLAMSDDLSMKALQGPVGARAAAVLGAGYDLALHCNGEMAEMEAVAASAGHLTGAALARHDTVEMLRHRLMPGPVDLAEVRRRIDALSMKETTDA